MLVDNLRSVKEILLRDGWCQRSVQTRGKHCFVGAINVAMTGNAWDHSIGEEGQQVANVLRKSVGIGSLSCWNDQRDRTFDEVIAAIDKAILECEGDNIGPVSETTQVQTGDSDTIEELLLVS